jgi:hypothetical protein
VVVGVVVVAVVAVSGGVTSQRRCSVGPAHRLLTPRRI